MEENNTNQARECILLFVNRVIIVGLICSAEPKYSMSGCCKDAKEDSSYCYLHDLSNQVYGKPDYHEVYENSKRNRERYHGDDEYAAGVDDAIDELGWQQMSLDRRQ